jgi:sulfoxide reductase heme-binding subunit YedZ
VYLYLGYALVVMHFTARFAGDPPRMWRFLGLLWLVAMAVAGLHVAAALKEARGDRPAPVGADGLILLGTFTELAEGRAVAVSADGERVAVVRKDGALHALSNVCPHQDSPLGEGVVRNGYLECPWHGYQFDPCTGLGPPGFADGGRTYLKMEPGGRPCLQQMGA